MGITDLQSTDGFIKVDKYLTKIIGFQEAGVMAELCSEHNYWRDRGELDDGFFFSTVENIENQINIKRKTQERLISTLVKYGLIEVKKKGLPQKRYIRINEEKLAEIYGLRQLEQKGQNGPFNTDDLDVLKGTICTNNKNKVISNIANTNIASNRETTKVTHISSARFKKPTVEELRQYIKSIGADIDAEYFYDYYETNGWVVGRAKTPMKNWKASVRLWNKNQYQSGRTTNNQDTPTPSQRPPMSIKEFNEATGKFLPPEAYDETGNYREDYEGDR